MRKLDELDEIIAAYGKGKMDRRTFISKALVMGLTLTSINAFLSSFGKGVSMAFAQTPPAGKPANVTFCYNTSWFGSWATMYVKHKELWKYYLPAGSQLEMNYQVVGPSIVNNLLGNKAQIGNLGDMPAYVAASRREIADLRIVNCDIFSDTGQMCSYLMVRSDAPEFKDNDEAVKWLDGKKIGVAGKGSCGDRFILFLTNKANIKAEIQYLDPTIIKTALQARKIDAAQSWQPHAAQIMNRGFGRLLFTGAFWGAQDGSFNVMRKDFIDAYPEAAKGYLKSEIVGLQVLMKDPYEAVKTIAPELPGFTTKDIWMSIYGQNAAGTGSTGPKVNSPLVFSKEIMDFINGGFKFLKSKGVLAIDQPLPDAVYPDLINSVVQEMNIQTPMGPIPVYPTSDFNPNAA
ncbi:MAG: ABC transporter substrate-binding protein [Desulfobaccales bacterium]